MQNFCDQKAANVVWWPLFLPSLSNSFYLRTDWLIRKRFGCKSIFDLNMNICGKFAIDENGARNRFNCLTRFRHKNMDEMCKQFISIRKCIYTNVFAFLEINWPALLDRINMPFTKRTMITQTEKWATNREATAAEIYLGMWDVGHRMCHIFNWKGFGVASQTALISFDIHHDVNAIWRTIFLFTS